MEPKTSVQVNLSAVGNIVYPIALLVVGFGLAVLGEGHLKWGGIVFIVASIGCFFWGRSNAVTETPIRSTTYEDENVKFEFDPRSEPAPAMMKLLESCIGKLNVKPLPESSGLVDSDMNPIPNSIDQANERVNEVNELVREMAKVLETDFDEQKYQADTGGLLPPDDDNNRLV